MFVDFYFRMSVTFSGADQKPPVSRNRHKSMGEDEVKAIVEKVLKNVTKIPYGFNVSTSEVNTGQPGSHQSSYDVIMLAGVI